MQSSSADRIVALRSQPTNVATISNSGLCITGLDDVQDDYESAPVESEDTTANFDANEDSESAAPSTPAEMGSLNEIRRLNPRKFDYTSLHFERYEIRASLPEYHARGMMTFINSIPMPSEVAKIPKKITYVRERGSSVIPAKEKVILCGNTMIAHPDPEKADPDEAWDQRQAVVACFYAQIMAQKKTTLRDFILRRSWIYNPGNMGGNASAGIDTDKLHNLFWLGHERIEQDWRHASKLFREV